jgi:peptide/nickel transport system substrate-binding protein
MAKHLFVLYCYLSILVAVFVLNSCNTQKQIESSKVFRYNEYRNVTSLDPAFSRNPQNIWPINQLFNGLVQLNKKLEVVPEIANSWTISSDGLTYVFNLRERCLLSYLSTFWTK